MPGKTRWRSASARRSMPASMRPQRNAGENQAGLKGGILLPLASMRPQRNAGENLPPPPRYAQVPIASMRPQRNAGENAPLRIGPSPKIGGFNEAPAKCRGKRKMSALQPSATQRFNEAPAKCRGKPDMPQVRWPTAAASMRPQRNAGENGIRQHIFRPIAHGFNEAQRNAGENEAEH